MCPGRPIALAFSFLSGLALLQYTFSIIAKKRPGFPLSCFIALAFLGFEPNQGFLVLAFLVFPLTQRVLLLLQFLSRGFNIGTGVAPRLAWNVFEWALVMGGCY